MSENFTPESPELIEQFYTLPLRDVVMFPQMVTTILVGREKSINAVYHAQKQKKSIFVIAQINPDTDDFTNKNLASLRNSASPITWPPASSRFRALTLRL